MSTEAPAGTRAATVLRYVPGLVLLLVIFMLLKREDLRSRLIRVIGQGRISATTQAIPTRSGSTCLAGTPVPSSGAYSPDGGATTSPHNPRTPPL